MSSDIIDLPMTDVQAEERVFSEAELAVICDLVVSHHLPELAAHELVRIPGNQWSVWSAYNMQQVAKARREDDTRDWYFPISVSHWWPKDGEFTPPDRCFTWKGIWHPTATDVSATLRRLPPMTCLLKEWQFAGFPLCDIVASEGGLLLIRARPEVVPVRRSSRTNKRQANSAPSWPPRFGRGHSKDSPVDWIRLLVCNPITREWKELPEPKCADMGCNSWQEVYSKGVHVHMEVNDEANSYQVILILHIFVTVYKSTTDSWNCVRFRASIGPRWAIRVATALVGTGQLYAAHIQSAIVLDRARDDAVEGDGATRVRVGTLRLFRADIEASSWMPVHEYRLGWFHPLSFNPYTDDFGFPLKFLENVHLLECMGSLYAVIPSWRHDVLAIGEKAIGRQDFGLPPPSESSTKLHKFLPLAFNLMRLNGESAENVVLRIPLGTLDRTGSGKSYGDFTWVLERMRRTCKFAGVAAWGRKWFTCTVRGSTIWVLFQDCLLSFDVVSRKYAVRYLHSEQTHQSMSHTSDDMSEWSHFSYRPSFHMKP